MSRRVDAVTTLTSPSTVAHDPTSTGTGMSRPRPLACSSVGDGVLVESVGADAVHGVRRQHDQLTGCHARRRSRQSDQPGVGVRAVVHLEHAAILPHARPLRSNPAARPLPGEADGR